MKMASLTIHLKILQRFLLAADRVVNEQMGTTQRHPILGSRFNTLCIFNIIRDIMGIPLQTTTPAELFVS